MPLIGFLAMALIQLTKILNAALSLVGWVAAPSQPNTYRECWVAKKTATQPTPLLRQYRYIMNDEQV